MSLHNLNYLLSAIKFVTISSTLSAWSAMPELFRGVIEK